MIFGTVECEPGVLLQDRMRYDVGPYLVRARVFARRARYLAHEVTSLEPIR